STGQLMGTYNYKEAGKAVIKIEHLTKGSYIVRVKANTTIENFKLIKY
ncbi:MAG: T9SS type A sorting domain-containing protein, partial [Pedobacter sp.]|nr:T9SS type A sorting domain-containing protein [Pedobacter sp.]